jgi:hypothetical protein
MTDAVPRKSPFSKSWIVTLIFVFILPTATNAHSFVRTAKSGVATRVYSYHAHQRDCRETLGIIKVLTKPQHGRLTPNREVSTLKSNRFNSADACIGSQLNGFRVDYTSAPGYRGVDNFAIEYTNGLRSTVIDYFTVYVE